MPKRRNVVKINDRVNKLRVPMKFRIGTRKSGKSGFLMTNKELLDVLESKDKKRWHNNARSVLAIRGVTV